MTSWHRSKTMASGGYAKQLRNMCMYPIPRYEECKAEIQEALEGLPKDLNVFQHLSAELCVSISAARSCAFLLYPMSSWFRKVQDDICYSTLVESKNSVEEKISKCKLRTQRTRPTQFWAPQRVDAEINQRWKNLRQFLPFEYFLKAPKWLADGGSRKASMSSEA